MYRRSVMKLTNLILIGTAMASTVLAACGSDTVDTAAGSAPFDGQWAIEQLLDGNGDLVAPVEGSLPFIKVTEDEILGATGCNSFFASVEIGADGTWKSDEIGSTLMACSPELMAQEGAITGAVRDADSWIVEGDTAKLASGSDTVLVATRLIVTLEGSRWSVTGINNGTGGVTSIVVDTEPTLEFDTDGQMSATAGCNTMSGTFETTDDVLAIGPVVQTEMFCPKPDGLMEQENAMSTALGNVATYEIAGYGLTLRDDTGNTLLTAELIPDTE